MGRSRSKNLKMKTTFELSKPNARARFFGDFVQSVDQSEVFNRRQYNLSSNRNREFQNISKRWRYCTEKEEKWAKETKYSAVQLLTNNAFWREKNGGKKKKKIQEQFQFFEHGLVHDCLRASERVRFSFNFNIDQASAIFLAVR